MFVDEEENVVDFVTADFVGTSPSAMFIGRNNVQSSCRMSGDLLMPYDIEMHSEKITRIVVRCDIAFNGDSFNESLASNKSYVQISIS